MKKIETLTEIQDLLYELLVTLDEFCKENNLQYALSGGSCLGAIRHKGFIPWDDDIDVVMPRPDYDRLIEITATKEISPHTELMCMEREDYYQYPFAKLINTRTELHEDHYREFPMGIFLDIFPLDGVAETEAEQEKICNEIKHCQTMLCGTFWKYQRGNESLLQYIGSCIGAFFSHFAYHKIRRHYITKMNRIARTYSYETSDKVGCIVWGVGWKRENQKKEVFFPTERREPFRDREFSVPANAEQYLKSMFGDYMKLPPEDQRPQHMFDAYYKKV